MEPSRKRLRLNNYEDDESSESDADSESNEEIFENSLQDLIFARRKPIQENLQAKVEQIKSKEEYFVVQDKGALVHKHYKFQRYLHHGKFANVLLMYDIKNKRNEIFKISKSNDVSKDKAQREIDFLKSLNRRGRRLATNMIHLQESFIVGEQNFVGMILEYRSCNLRQLMNSECKGNDECKVKPNHKNLLPFEDVIHCAKSLFNALDYLNLKKIIHSDLKPENIVCDSNDMATLRIIDFEKSLHFSESHCPDNNDLPSLNYRAPEMLFGPHFGPSVDVWSVGCILMEMFSGEVLFKSIDDMDHMNRIAEVFGLPPEEFLCENCHCNKYFNGVDENRKLKIKNDAKRKYAKAGTYDLRKQFQLAEKHRNSKENCGDAFKNEQFLMLLKSTFQYLPEERIKPKDALHNKLFCSK